MALLFLQVGLRLRDGCKYQSIDETSPGGPVDNGVDISSISMVEGNLLSILAKSDFEFNGQIKVCQEKNRWQKKGENRRNQKIMNVDKGKMRKNTLVSP